MIALLIFVLFVSTVSGFCHINTVTHTQKLMLMSTSDTINKNVQDLINKYSFKTGTRPERIMNCVQNKRQQQWKTNYQHKKNKYLRTKMQ